MSFLTSRPWLDEAAPFIPPAVGSDGKIAFMLSWLRNPSAMSGAISGLIALLVFGGPALARQAPQVVPGVGEGIVLDSMVVLPDGRNLHLKCSGVGAPTIILDAGLGLDSSVWARVRPGLAAITRTCAYDRAGYGDSDPGPMPRDFTRRADDLLGLLGATEEEGPFVLVAHSAAESTARFAGARRPEMIAGLVLIDPGPQVEALKSIAPVWAAAFDAGQSMAFGCIWATAAGEMRPGNAIYAKCGSPPADSRLANREMAAAVLSESEPDRSGVGDVPGAPGELGDMPLIVLTAASKFGETEGAAPTETRPLRQAWADAGAAIAATSTRGEQRMVPDASHVIQFEQPDTVIDAVRDVVDQVRAGNASGAPGA